MPNDNYNNIELTPEETQALETFETTESPADDKASEQETTVEETSLTANAEEEVTEPTEYERFVKKGGEEVSPKTVFNIATKILGAEELAQVNFRD